MAAASTQSPGAPPRVQGPLCPGSAPHSGTPGQRPHPEPPTQCPRAPDSHILGDWGVADGVGRGWDAGLAAVAAPAAVQAGHVDAIETVVRLPRPWGGLLLPVLVGASAGRDTGAGSGLMLTRGHRPEASSGADVPACSPGSPGLWVRLPGTQGCCLPTKRRGRGCPGEHRGRCLRTAPACRTGLRRETCPHWLLTRPSPGLGAPLGRL